MITDEERVFIMSPDIIIDDVEPVFIPHAWPWSDKAPAYVYRCFDADMKPLYVGVTVQHPYGRLSNHVSQVKWTNRVRHVDWAEFPNKATAEHYEATEIRRLRPPYNKSLGNCGCKEHALRSTTTSSRFKGVSRSEALGKWIAQIRISGKLVSLGRFADEIDAARAYDHAALESFGEDASTNQTMGLYGTDDSQEITHVR